MCPSADLSKLSNQIQVRASRKYIRTPRVIVLEMSDEHCDSITIMDLYIIEQDARLETCFQYSFPPNAIYNKINCSK